MGMRSPHKNYQKVFVSQERVSGFPEKGAYLRGSRGTSGEVWGTSREVWGTSGEPSRRKTSGEVRGTAGEVWDFPEARGSLTPSERLAKSVSKSDHRVIAVSCFPMLSKTVQGCGSLTAAVTFRLGCCRLRDLMQRWQKAGQLHVVNAKLLAALLSFMVSQVRDRHP